MSLRILYPYLTARKSAIVLLDVKLYRTSKEEELVWGALDRVMGHRKKQGLQMKMIGCVSLKQVNKKTKRIPRINLELFIFTN